MNTRSRLCGHDSGEGGTICGHIWAECHKGADERNLEYCLRFTGRGRERVLVCSRCSEEIEGPSHDLCDGCMDTIEEAASGGNPLACLDQSGEPGFPEARGDLTLVRRDVTLPGISLDAIVDLQPVEAAKSSQWMALMRDGSLLLWDMDQGTLTERYKMSRGQLDLYPVPTLLQSLGSAEPRPRAHHFPKWEFLKVSPRGDMALIGARRGEKIRLVDLDAGTVKLEIDRGGYRISHYDFSLAFVPRQDRLLLAAATAWNRLDVFDCGSGEVVTPRPTPQGDQEGHALDYFHSGLTVSPTSQWLADNGWVWHPIGVVRTFDLDRWLTANPWESEDGPSARALCSRLYYWEGDVCWIDGNTLAVYGYGSDDEWIVPAVMLFDVREGRRVDWFPGPVGSLAFDGHLFSYDPQHGTSAWDVATGARVLHEPETRAIRFHPGARCFLTLTPTGVVCHAIQDGA